MPPLSIAGPHGADWTTHFRTPDHWQRHLEQLGGGYFHSPVGLDTLAAPGQTVFFEWRSGSATVGLAAGLQSPCRLSGAPRHVYLPTPPAVRRGWKREAALRALIASLRAQHMAELVCDSFHAEGVPPLDTAPVEIRRRFEYVMPLDAPTVALLGRWAPGHRIQLEAARGFGWTLATPTGHDVHDLLVAVRHDAVPPAPPPDGEPFAGALDVDIALGATDLAQPWGRAVFAVLEDGRPLALAIVGWANKRAYHLLEIVTRAGQARPAMPWLYAQIVDALCAHGFHSYHLGGAPASVADPREETYAFHQDRLGLGGVPVFSVCARWVLDAPHAARHRMITPAAVDAHEAGTALVG